MSSQDDLASRQRENEFNTFRKYERMYWEAYSRSQNPYPSKRLGPSFRWKLRGNGSSSSFD